MGEDAEVSDVIGGIHHAIAPVGKYGGRDRVWITYPSFNASGRQTYVVAILTFGGSSEPRVELVANVTAEDPKTVSATIGAFVSDDLVDADDQNADPPCTLFYWAEIPLKASTTDDELLAH
jgi:hypothetical protein